MGVDIQCPRCLEEEESVEHLYFQCPFAKHIWKGSQLGLDFESWQSLLVQEWIEWWFRNPPDEQAIVEAIKVLWGIWIHRNKAVFQKDIEHPIWTIAWINHLDLPSNRQLHAKLMGINYVKNREMFPLLLLTMLVGVQILLCIDFLIDGAWRQQSSQAAAAWVAMDCNRNPIIKQQFSFTASSALVPKAKACLEVLKWRSQHQIMSAKILTNCQMLIT